VLSSALTLMFLAAEPPPLPAAEQTIELRLGEEKRFRASVTRVAVSGCSVTDVEIRTEGRDVLAFRGVRPTKRCPIFLWLSGERRHLLYVTVTKAE
jgi:hypothetical protein